MEELLDSALEQLIANADGDVRRAMRALLIEAFRLQLALDRLGGCAPEGAMPPKKLMN